MSNNSIRQHIEELRASNDPEKNAIAAALSKYLDTRDPVALSLLIPFNSQYHIDHLSSLAWLGDDPDAYATLDFLVLAMAAPTTAFPVKRSGHDYPNHTVQSPAEDFFVAFLYSFDSYLAPLTLQRMIAIRQQFLESAELFGVTRLRLSCCLMTGLGWKLNFGWTKAADTLSYPGCGGNVVYSSEDPPTSMGEFGPIESIVWDMTDEEIVEFLLLQVDAPQFYNGIFAHRFRRLHGALAVFKPHIIDQFLALATQEQIQTIAWEQVVRSTARFDARVIVYAKNLAGNQSLKLLVLIDALRPGTCTDEALAFVFDPAWIPDESGMSYIRDLHPAKLPAYLSASLAHRRRISQYISHTVKTSFSVIARNWNPEGRSLMFELAGIPPVLMGGSTNGLISLQEIALRCMLEADSLPYENDLRAYLAVFLKSIEGSGLPAKDQFDVRRYLYNTIIQLHPEIFPEELWSLLHDKSKVLRDLAIASLAKFPSEQTVPRAVDLLQSKKAEFRSSAADLLGMIASTSGIPSLLAALEAETSEPVRIALHEAIKKCGESTPLPSANPATVPKVNLKGLKMPSCAWLKLSQLPPLYGKDGALLTEEAITFLIAKQSKQKDITASADITPLLDSIDRSKSTDFALALVEGFLHSEQAASDRWALTLGGLLGDQRIIPPLLSRIQDWCENSRHKLAEYAAQAIALLPGNEALMVLDTLANRYRSKFKNVGKACADAFNAAATARGITPDELGDMVVPDFGFDAEGTRRFEWQGGGASAELTPDFKLSWFDPETDKSWKSLPANAPDDIKNEVKTLTKLLREAVKGQTARLELSLVRQRRWPVARWKELFENHPLLRSFASGLVWGIYDGQGALLRTFRRYANGILADAAGGIEELTETDSVIGMIHPLELTPESLALWRGHLARMKVKPPFAQLDRPVELMDPLHGNRKSISLTEGKSISAGTFRSRAEKRGWTRGSVIDAGGIASYYKIYPGAGVEVNLPTDGLYIGCDPMDSITLSAAYFTVAGTIERGSYMYDDPAPDDPRVLRFGQIPPVVFSETLGDLKAIIATKE